MNGVTIDFDYCQHSAYDKDKIRLNASILPASAYEDWQGCERYASGFQCLGEIDRFVLGWMDLRQVKDHSTVAMAWASRNE